LAGKAFKETDIRDQHPAPSLLTKRSETCSRLIPACMGIEADGGWPKATSGLDDSQVVNPSEGWTGTFRKAAKEFGIGRSQDPVDGFVVGNRCWGRLI